MTHKALPSADNTAPFVHGAFDFILFIFVLQENFMFAVLTFIGEQP